MRRIPALDGLRGVAVLVVVGNHAYEFPFGGELGVDLFFLLSGFLITSLLLEERLRTGSFSMRGFYARRARRLLPALLLLLAVFLVVEAARGRDGSPTVLEYGLYTGNIYAAFIHPLRGSTVALGHLWSLAEEEQFYLVWPAVLLLLARARRPARWIIAAVVALVAYRIGLQLAGASHDRLYLGPDTHSDGLLLGSALAFVRVQRVPERLVQCAVIVAGACLAVRPQFAQWDAYGLPVFEAAAAVILVGATCETQLAKLLSAGWIRWFGRISYSLYLWHYLLLWEFGHHNKPVAVALAIAIAYASTRWIEEPIRRLGRVRREQLVVQGQIA